MAISILDTIMGLTSSIAGVFFMKCTENKENTPAKCGTMLLSAYVTIAGAIYAIYALPTVVNKLKSLFSKIRQKLGTNGTLEEVNTASAEAKAKSE